MTPNRQGTKISVVCLCLLFFLSSIAFGGVCFTHRYTIDELLLGTKQAELKVSYTGTTMVVDKITRFTGTWMKRFFGEVKQERFSTLFLIDEDRIREIDWQDQRLYLYELGKLDQLSWFQKDPAQEQALADHLKERYTVKQPALSFSIDPEEKILNGYSCRRVTAQLALETHDHVKDTVSKTLVEQRSWLSEAVEGYSEYRRFHQLLSERLGVDAERLGPLTYLLRYWDGDLAPIRDRLKKVSGYPVKTETVVTAIYITSPGSDAAKTIKKVIKKETALLSNVSSKIQDQEQFQIPDTFETIWVRQ